MAQGTETQHPLEVGWLAALTVLITGSLAAVAWTQGRTSSAGFFALLCALTLLTPLWRVVRARRRPRARTMQYAAFRGLLRFFLLCAVIAVVMFIAAAAADDDKDRRPLIGMGILMSGFAFLIAIPTWSAWQKRHTDEPWGIDGP